MNGFSFFLIVASAALFGYVFGDLLRELGISKKMAHSWMGVFGLALLGLLSYIVFPIFTHGAFVLNFEINGYWSNFGGIFLWFSVGLFLGGAGKMGEIFLREQRGTAHAAPVQHVPPAISEGQKAQ